MMRLVLALALLSIACGRAESAPAPQREPAPREELEVSEPEPIRELPLPAPRVVRVETSDGVVVVGDLRVGAGDGAPLVVLVHQLGSTRREWEPLLRRLAAPPALSTFALDMRGHGESNTRANGSSVDASSFQAADWEAIGRDVVQAILYLRQHERLEPSHVAVVGSSIGSSAAILAAAQDRSIDAIVALSPGRAYRGVDALTPLAALGDRPLLAIAARGETPSVETANDMDRIAASGEAMLVDGDRHGVSMYSSAPEALDRSVAFLREHLGANE